MNKVLSWIGICIGIGLTGLRISQTGIGRGDDPIGSYIAQVIGALGLTATISWVITSIPTKGKPPV